MLFLPSLSKDVDLPSAESSLSVRLGEFYLPRSNALSVENDRQFDCMTSLGSISLVLCDLYRA